MQKIIQILMKRDNLTVDEAWQTVHDCQKEIDTILADPNGTLEQCEDALRYWLGLEPDYIDYFM